MTLTTAQVAMLSGVVACGAFLIELFRPLRDSRGVRGNSYPLPTAALAAALGFTVTFVFLLLANGGLG